MIKITVTMTPPLDDREASFRQLASTGIYEGVGRLAQEADELMLQALKDEAPKNTGAFAGGISSAQRGGEGVVQFDYMAPDPLATFIIGGTRPHDIWPTSARALVFLGAGGQMVFARHVNHPGTKANDFPTRAWTSVRSDVLDIMARTGREILDSVK